MTKIAIYFLSAIILSTIVIGCSENDMLPEPQIIIANDKNEIQIDAKMMDSLFIPVLITSEEFLQNIKIFSLDSKGNEYILKNYFFDSPINELSDTCYYPDFIKEGFPQIDRLSYFGATATTIQSITKTERTPFVFSNFDSPLAEERDFTWTRVGIDDGEGVADFGLKWKNSIVDPFALIEIDRAEKMVLLPFNQWANIAYEEELINIINAATPIQAVSNISTVNPANYDIVLGIVFNKDFFLLRVVQSIIIEEETVGKTVVITGFYKKTSSPSK